MPVGKGISLKNSVKYSILGAGALSVLAGSLVWNLTNFKPETVIPAIQPDGQGDDDPIDLTAAARHLGEAVRFRTVSNQDAAQNDLSQWSGLHDWLGNSYPAMHQKLSRQLIDERTLVYQWAGSDSQLEPIILMAHQDVVPITEGSEKDWKYPPFDGVLAENAIWGRGTVDDKGSLIALVEAIELLVGKGFVPKRTIYIVSGHDEEVGGAGARAAARYLEEKGVKALFALDEGSAVIKNAPVIDRSAAFIGIAEKGYATLKVTAEAEGGHSSMPPRETAVVNLARAVTAINGAKFPLKLDGPGGEMIDVLAAEKGGIMKLAVANKWLFNGQIKRQIAATPSGAALLHTTIAPTMLQGSPKENVLPQSATALINYRIAPWDRSADIMEKAKAAVGNIQVSFSWVNPPKEPSKISSTSSDGWKYVAGAARLSAPDAAIAPYLVIAATDGRSMEGVARDVYRFMPVELSLDETAMIHGTNEHMTVDNLERLIKFYMQLIRSSAG